MYIQHKTIYICFVQRSEQYPDHHRSIYPYMPKHQLPQQAQPFRLDLPSYIKVFASILDVPVWEAQGRRSDVVSLSWWWWWWWNLPWIFWMCFLAVFFFQRKCLYINIVFFWEVMAVLLKGDASVDSLGGMLFEDVWGWANGRLVAWGGWLWWGLNGPQLADLFGSSRESRPPKEREPEQTLLMEEIPNNYLECIKPCE